MTTTPTSTFDLDVLSNIAVQGSDDASYETRIQDPALAAALQSQRMLDFLADAPPFRGGSEAEAENRMASILHGFDLAFDGAANTP